MLHGEARTIHAVVPAALSSIFSPKTMDGDRPRTNPDLIGARGGGFAFDNGAETWVTLVKDGDGIYINVNDTINDFPPSLEAARLLKERLGISGSMFVRHRIAVPLGTGFGTSAAAAVGVFLAGSYAAGRPFSLMEAARLTHYVELKCRTGLNSEAGVFANGLVVVKREGSPVNCLIDIIPLPAKCKIVAVVAGMLKTPEVLEDMTRMRLAEKVGDMKLEQILEEPTLENFLLRAREFAWEAGFVTREVKEMLDVFQSLPVIGYAQNMLGRAVHAVVYEDDASRVVEVLKKRFPHYSLISSDLGHGVKLQQAE